MAWFADRVRDKSRPRRSTLRAAQRRWQPAGLSGEQLEDRCLLSIQPVAVSSQGSYSGEHSISGDGRFVAFYTSDKLSPSDINGSWDVYVRDMNGVYELVSISSFTGEAGDGTSLNASISADGRYVAFQSNANNLVAGDTNNRADIFVRDRLLGTTTRVGLDGAGQANKNSINPILSGDGTHVAFVSEATNLVPGDPNGGNYIFVANLQTGAITPVNTGSSAAGYGGAEPSLSFDGRYLAFQSSASDLVPNDLNGKSDIFVRDLQMGVTSLLGAVGGVQANGDSYEPSISGDGRYVAFVSFATNLTANDLNGFLDVFVHDRQTAEVTQVSTGSAGAANGHSGSMSISADGRFVAFQSSATNLVSSDTNGFSDIFVRDLQLNKTRAVKTLGGQLANAISIYPSISSDGRYVAFESKASNLGLSNSGGLSNAYLWDDDRLDFVAPTVASTSYTEGAVSTNATSLSVTFSEVIVGSPAGSEYQLRSPGADGQFATADDIVMPITSVTYGPNSASLGFAPLAAGVYRLTIEDTVVDELGNRLDGDNDGQALGDYVFDFTVTDELLLNGWIDPTFGSHGFVTEPYGGPEKLALQTDGKIVAAGGISVGENAGFAVVRYNADGSLDTNFGVGGIAFAGIEGKGGTAAAVVLQSDGKIVAAGKFISRFNTSPGVYRYIGDFAVVRYNLDGSLDTSFGNGGIVRTPFSEGEDGAFEILLQPDGKLAAVGGVQSSATFDFAVARYNSDGSLDSSFGIGGKVITAIDRNQVARAALLQADGKILAAGTALTSPNYDFALVRYNPDGSLDNSFGGDGRVTTGFTNGVVNGSDNIEDVAIQLDGRIVAVGRTITEGANGGWAIARYNVDGSLDPSFGVGGQSIVFEDGFEAQAVKILLDGKILVAGDSPAGIFTLLRLMPTGQPDATFGADGVVAALPPTISYQEFPKDIVLLPDGSVVAGAYSRNGNSHFLLARFNPFQQGANVVAQYAFYNNSQLDGESKGATTADDDAIAVDKAALRPGGTATSANYTSFSQGINGIMVDIAGAAPESLSASDFQFRVGNSNSPGNWTLAPAPSSITVRPGEGAGGSDRFTLIWPDDAIKNTWLEVTLLSTAATRLSEPYVFYYGNAVGETCNSASDAAVNATDEIGARNHPQTFLDPAAIGNVYDFNRDGLVNATDQIIARSNATTMANALKLISVPAAQSAGALAASLQVNEAASLLNSLAVTASEESDIASGIAASGIAATGLKSTNYPQTAIAKSPATSTAEPAHLALAFKVALARTDDDFADPRQPHAAEILAAGEFYLTAEQIKADESLYELIASEQAAAQF